MHVLNYATHAYSQKICLLLTITRETTATALRDKPLLLTLVHLADTLLKLADHVL